MVSFTDAFSSLFFAYVCGLNNSEILLITRLNVDTICYYELGICSIIHFLGTVPSSQLEIVPLEYLL